MATLTFKVSSILEDEDDKSKLARETLTHDNIAKRLKKKHSFPTIGPEHRKKIRFEPPLQDETMGVVAVVQVAAGERERTIELPVDNIFENLAGRISKLEGHVSRLVECMSRTDDRCFALYAGNLAIKFATKIDENKMSEQAEATEKRDTFPSQDGVKGHMAKRLCGQNLTKEDLDRHHLPAKYLKLFQNLSELVENCNTGAHDTEAAFAELLLREPYYQCSAYYFYGGLYPFLFGKTVEELAKQKGSQLALDITKEY